MLIKLLGSSPIVLGCLITGIVLAIMQNNMLWLILAFVPLGMVFLIGILMLIFLLIVSIVAILND